MKLLLSNPKSEISNLKSQISDFHPQSSNLKSQISNFKSQISNPPSRRAFSLVEVLLAIFILGIGMIMVASVFPVGANWTRQTAEQSVGQTVAQNALAVIHGHYDGPNGDLQKFFGPDTTVNTILGHSNGVSSFTVQALPGFLGIPPYERAYQFGSSNPFPAKDLTNCSYFWTALGRLNPVHSDSAGNILPSSSYTYDIYILVFRKGAVEQHFSNPSSTWPSGFVEVPYTRDPSWSAPTLVPSVGYAAWSGGSYNASNTPSVFNAFPPMGQYGIGANSGTVFHQVLDPATFTGATPRPNLLGTLPQNNSNLPQERVIYAPAADGTANSASPLIYVYQTTMSF